MSILGPIPPGTTTYPTLVPHYDSPPSASLPANYTLVHRSTNHQALPSSTLLYIPVGRGGPSGQLACEPRPAAPVALGQNKATLCPKSLAKHDVCRFHSLSSGERDKKLGLDRRHASSPSRWCGVPMHACLTSSGCVCCTSVAVSCYPLPPPFSPFLRPIPNQ